MSFTNTKRHVELVIEKINNEIAISIIKLKKNCCEAKKQKDRSLLSKKK